MKLHSPAFERRLRRRVKQTIRASPELKREARRTNRARRYSGRSFLRLLGSALAAGLTVSIVRRTGHPGTALVFVGIWLLAAISFQVQALAHHLYASPDLSALGMLPIPAPAVFRRQSEKFLRGTSWLLVDLLAMLGALAIWTELPVATWLALLPIIVLSWLITVALTGLAAVYCPRLPYPLISMAVMLTGFLLCFTGSYVGPTLLAVLDRSADTLRLLLPTAWPASLFLCLRPGGFWLVLLFLVPSLGLIWTLRHTRSRLASGYEFAESLLPEPHDVLPPEVTPVFQGANGAPARAGRTTIEEFVTSRGFLSGPTWFRNGWCEARLWQWLTARERKVVEFVFPQDLWITRSWSKVFLHLAVGGVLGLALGWLNPALQFWVWLGVMLWTGLRALASFYANGRAFSPMFCSGVNIQMHVVYPLGYRELSRVLFKYSLVQLPLLAGYGAICGAGIAWLGGLQWLAGVVIGFKLAVLLGAARFIFVTLAFSAGTNDSSTLRWRTVVLVGVVVLLGLVFLGLGAAGVLVPQPLLAVGLWVAAILDAWWLWRLYGWFYNTNRFDVMNLPRQSA